MADRLLTLTAILTPEEGGYVARCIELGVTTEGDTLTEALAMLREAVELYIEGDVVPITISFDATAPTA